MPSVKSIHNAPDGKKSIQYEIYFNVRETAPIAEECIHNCHMALKRMGIYVERSGFYVWD